MGYGEIRKQIFELLLPVLQRQLAKSLRSTKAGAKEPLALPKIYATGHSLGGSMAQLFALDLASNCKFILQQQIPPTTCTPSPTYPTEPGKYFPDSPGHLSTKVKDVPLQPPIGVYTYGQPRVGNRAFSRLYKQRVPHSFRVVNEGDAFTAIPNYLCCGGLY